MHYGSDDWAEISRGIDLDSSLRRERYADLYATTLRSIDEAVVVKNIPLRFSSVDRVVHHFFLTTRDADGAFRMNEILRKAEISQHYAIWADTLQRAQQREAASLQENLFGALDVPVAAAPALGVRTADPVEVMESILNKCPHGVAMSYKEFVKHIADEPFVRSEVHAALRRLKKDGRVEYDRLEGDSPILLK